MRLDVWQPSNRPPNFLVNEATPTDQPGRFNRLKLDNQVKTMNIVRSYNNWRRYRETVNELSRLSQRELSDLGIARGDISAIARRSVG